MAQAGRLVVCGDAGDALGDSIYEARIYVRGRRRVAGRRLHREGDARRAPRRARPTADGRGHRRRHRRLHAATARPGRSTTFTSTTRTALLMSSSTEEPRPTGPARVRHLRPRDHRRHPARRRDRHLRHPRLGRQARAAALRRPAVPGRLDVALPAGGLPRAVRHRRRPRRPPRQAPAAPRHPGHHRRHELRRAVRPTPRRRSGAAPARSAPRPPPATAA